jgi:hypothetical protein
LQRHIPKKALSKGRRSHAQHSTAAIAESSSGLQANWRLIVTLSRLGKTLNRVHVAIFTKNVSPQTLADDGSVCPLLRAQNGGLPGTVHRVRVLGGLEGPVLGEDDWSRAALTKTGFDSLYFSRKFSTCPVICCIFTLSAIHVAGPTWSFCK